MEHTIVINTLRKKVALVGSSILLQLQVEDFEGQEAILNLTQKEVEALVIKLNEWLANK